MTTTADKFLAAVLASPEEDAPRLVYADALEEFGGNADRLRAEFIRVQVAMAAHRREWPGQAVPWKRLLVREKLERRERELWLKEDAVSLGGLPFDFWAALGFTTGLDWFRRGFVEAVTCPARVWLDNADAILAACPVREVTLTTWPADDGDDSHWLMIPGKGGWRLTDPRWPGVTFVPTRERHIGETGPWDPRTLSYHPGEAETT